MKHKEKQKHLEGRHFNKTARMSRGPCDIQEDTPQRQTSVEAPARNQAAGDRIDFSKPFICVFSPPKRPCLDKDGPCNTQDKTPPPKSPLEAPACGQAEGKNSAFCQPITVVCSPSKGCMEVHMFRKTRRDEDVFHQPHQKVSCTGASERPAFQRLRKRKGTERHIQGRRISPGNVPKPESPVEAPACSPAAGEKSSFSEHPIGVSTPSKRTRLDEDVFHQPHQKVSCTGASEMPALEPVRKPKSTELHIQGPCNTQDKTPPPKLPLEAPACGQAEGKKSAFCQPITVVCSPSKGCMEVHMFRKTRRDEDVFHQPHQKVSCTGASERPAFQRLRKRKGTERHIQGRRLSQGNVPQPESPVEAPACSLAAGEKSSFSEHPIGVSTPSKHTRLDEDVFHQPHQKVSCTGASEMPALEPVRKPKSTELHIQGPCNTRDKTPPPKSPLEAPTCGQAEGKKSAFCQPITVVCSPSKGCMEVHMFRKTRRDEDVFHQPHQKVSCTGASEMPAFQRLRKRKGTERHIQGRRISPGNVPQPESPVEAPACSPAAGEKSSFSEHPIGVSTPSKHTRLDEDEIKEMPVSQDSEQTENSSDYSHTYIHSHAPNNNEPFMSPVHETDVRPMKIYYMHVQLKRGVAVLYHTKEGWEPPSKKIKMEEMTYIGKVHKNVPVYHTSEKKHLIAHEPMLDSGAQEKREEADSPAQLPAQGGYPRAKTPEWLVALDSGFRCMACCRVFPSLEILQDHVEYGVREGFSCHVFHNAVAHLKFKARKRRMKEKKEKATFRR